MYWVDIIGGTMVVKTTAEHEVSDSNAKYAKKVLLGKSLLDISQE